jgi:neutral ceramidase
MKKLVFNRSILSLSILSLGLTSGNLVAEPQSPTKIKVGSGIHDITGPSVDVGMLGYAQLTQIAQGVHTRLWARSFVIELPERPRKTLAFAVLDLGFVTHAIKQAVVIRLAEQLGEDPERPRTFTFENLMLMATHTHSAPGGFSHLTLYNLPFPGFNSQNFEAIVSGTVASLLKAHRNRTPGYIKFGETVLEGASHNRSKIAFFENPESRTLQFDTNKTMTQLEFYANSGEPVGLLNFFAVHATTLSNSNKMLSSDNKGIASILFDRKMKSDYLKDKTFVAAFANSDEGDVTPNPIIDGRMVREGNDEFQAMEISGRRQFEAAEHLFESRQPKTFIEPLFQNVHAFVEVPGLSFDGEQPLCEPAFGFSFAAGAEDGPGGFNIIEGITAGVSQGFSQIINILRFITAGLMGTPLLSNDICQYPKPVLLATSRGFPRPWTPRVIPFQIFRLGPVAIVAFPGEMTTVTGYRVRNRVAEILSDSGVRSVVIAGLANDYTSYLTTPEEFDKQHYEGASTLFGPRSEPVMSSLYARMAEHLEEGIVYPSKPVPDYSKGVWSGYIKPLPDIKAIWESWGREIDAPDRVIRIGEIARARFRAGNPSNDLATMKGYLEVQRNEANSGEAPKWITVARDWDLETTFRWKRATNFKCIECGESQLVWTPPEGTPSGEYRFLHRFPVKTVFGKIKKFETSSSTFLVTP